MEIQHMRKRIFADDNDKAQSYMKQLIYWILVVLAFICVVSLGMIIINYCIHAQISAGI